MQLHSEESYITDVDRIVKTLFENSLISIVLDFYNLIYQEHLFYYCPGGETGLEYL